MARIVAGLTTPHGPQMQRHWSTWHEFEKRDPNHVQLQAEPPVTYAELVARAKPDIKDDLTDEKWRDAYERRERGLDVLRSVIKETAPDIIVAIGDDQHEHLLDDNMPQFCVYWGDKLVNVDRERTPDRQGWIVATDLSGGEVRTEYPAAPDLAKHVIKSLISQGFDTAVSNELKAEVGLGHAFTFLYRLFPDGPIPLLPVMVNCFFPPNQPPPARCYALGQGLRCAIESWDSDKRVALIGSGGLSHVVIDEEVDRMTLDAIGKKDIELIAALPADRLIRGTSETRNWIVVAGAMEPLDFNLVDYIPAYRSSAAMGHALSFAYWK